MSELNETVLVTGASGFIAGHIIKELLCRGYNVRGTVRNLKNHTIKYKYLYDLQSEEHKKQHQLQLFEADLTKDDNWDNIINGCTYIMNVASPVPKRDEKNPISDQQMIDTAVNGIKRILNICLKYKKSIKRFICTSSDAAIDARIENINALIITTSSDKWSDIDNNKNITAYDKSKTLSEKYLWQFIKDNNNPFECVALNPAMVIGPLLNKHKPGSVDMVYALLNREFPFLPNYSAIFVDVRDVAIAHINALNARNVNGNRYVIANHVLWLKDVALILHDKYSNMGYDIPLTVQYDFVWKAIGIIEPVINEFIVPSLGVLRLADNTSTVQDLGVAFRAINETIIDCSDSLIKFGFIEKPSVSIKIIKRLGKLIVVGGFIGGIVYYGRKKGYF